VNRSVDRWTRRYVAASAVGFACWRTGALLGADRGVQVLAALLGVVFLVVFGKAYLLVPSFAGRTLRSGYVPAVQFPLAVGAGAAFGAVGAGPGAGMAARAGPLAALRAAHVEAMLAGFLGLTVVGFVLLFYPYADGGRAGSDAAAAAVVAVLAVGTAF
jgi:hypothetical protein